MINILELLEKTLSSDYSKLSSVDIIIVCLPTPLTKSNKPDISILKKCANKISRYLKENQMFILESTVYPGATIEIYKILNKYKKYKLGYNFFLSFPLKEKILVINYFHISTPQKLFLDIHRYVLKLLLISTN